MVSSEFEVDVIVVGAGIGGLALAVALGTRGMRVAVLEAGSRPESVGLSAQLDGWDSRVSALTPASVRFLDALGAWSSIADQRVGPYDQMYVWDGQGTGEIRFSAAEAGEPLLGHIVENRLTIAALLAVAEGNRNVSIHWQDALASIDSVSAQQVTAESAGGTRFSAPLLLGADGARSRVREKVGFETRSWSYDQHAIVSTIGLDDSHCATCYQAFLPSGPLALLPLADEALCSIVWSVDDPLLEGLMGADDERFIAELNRALGGRAPQVVSVGKRAAFPLRQCHAADYVKGRVALVADAAHSIHPLAGQGINLGLSDVRVLAEELWHAYSSDLDWGSKPVLARYQRARKGENLAMMAAMEGFKRGFGSGDPIVRVLRNTGLRWVNAATPLKRWFVSQALS